MQPTLMRFIRLSIYPALFFMVACVPVEFASKTAFGHLALMGKMRPISKILLDSNQPQALQDRLAYLLEARQFASDVLLLPDNKSYTFYADIGRDASIYNVFATEEFDFKPITWCFWFIGCLNYKGFFSLKEAQSLSDSLARRGYDSFASKSVAYSTLGWLDDPIVSPMLAWPDWRIVAFIYHELGHQKLYVPHDSTFMESFSCAVATIGTSQWLAAQGELQTLDEFNASEARKLEYIALINQGKVQLQTLYESGATAAQMRIEKQSIIASLRAEHQLLMQQWGGDYFSDWFAQDLNNAHFSQVSTYTALLPAFFQLFEDSGHQWEEFYRRARALAKLGASERTRQLNDLAARWQPSP